MSTTENADPLVSSIASVLRVPLVELYALLWRVGVVDVRQPRRPKAPRPAVVACPNCSTPPQRGSGHRSPQSPRRLPPEPVPSRPAPAGYSRATG
nr:Rv1535 domain-containing protein [Mycobacterium parmense]